MILVDLNCCVAETVGQLGTCGRRGLARPGDRGWRRRKDAHLFSYACQADRDRRGRILEAFTPRVFSRRCFVRTRRTSASINRENYFVFQPLLPEVISGIDWVAWIPFLQFGGCAHARSSMFVRSMELISPAERSRWLPGCARKD